MLLMYSRPPGHSFLPIKLVSVVDGTSLCKFRVRLLSNDKVDFLELCNNSLLIKQKNHALQVYNVFDGRCTNVPTSLFKSPEVPSPPSTSPRTATVTSYSAILYTFYRAGFHIPPKLKVKTPLLF